MVGAFAPVVDLVDLFLGNSAGRAVKNDFARADADDAVTVFEREVHVVDVQQNRNFIFLVDAHEVLHDLLGRNGDSREATGSSARMIFGFWFSVRARATRCC